MMEPTKHFLHQSYWSINKEVIQLENHFWLMWFLLLWIEYFLGNHKPLTFRMSKSHWKVFLFFHSRHKDTLEGEEEVLSVREVTDRQMAHALQFSHSFKCTRLCCIFQHTYTEEQILSGSGWTFVVHYRELWVGDMSHPVLPSYVICTTNLTILKKAFKNVAFVSENTGNRQNTRVWKSSCMKSS